MQMVAAPSRTVLCRAPSGAIAHSRRERAPCEGALLAVYPGRPCWRMPDVAVHVCGTLWNANVLLVLLLGFPWSLLYVMCPNLLHHVLRDFVRTRPRGAGAGPQGFGVWGTAAPRPRGDTPAGRPGPPIGRSTTVVWSGVEARVFWDPRCGAGARPRGPGRPPASGHRCTPGRGQVGVSAGVRPPPGTGTSFYQPTTTLS